MNEKVSAVKSSQLGSLNNSDGEKGNPVAVYSNFILTCVLQPYVATACMHIYIFITPNTDNLGCSCWQDKLL